MCGGLTDREMSEQVLDSMELERERGITIKAQSVSLKYKSRNGDWYSLNFIDTPGHVDFAYEVSRSLSACEGALLVVDASQGVEAQTLANCYAAVDLGLEVIPVLNKIDLVDSVELQPMLLQHAHRVQPLPDSALASKLNIRTSPQAAAGDGSTAAALLQGGL